MRLVCIQNSSLLVYRKSQKVSASYCIPFQHSSGKNQPVGGIRPPPGLFMVNIWIWSFWLTFTVLQWVKTNFKISQFSRFLLGSGYAIEFKIWKWLKLLNSVPFLKKTLVNQVCIRIWSSWLTFTVLQWMKKNSKISQFSSFLLRSGYQMLVKTR